MTGRHYFYGVSETDTPTTPDTVSLFYNRSAAIREARSVAYKTGASVLFERQVAPKKTGWYIIGRMHRDDNGQGE